MWQLHVGERSCSVCTPGVCDANYRAEVMLHYADCTPSSVSLISCVCNCFIFTSSH